MLRIASAMPRFTCHSLICLDAAESRLDSGAVRYLNTGGRVVLSSPRRVLSVRRWELVGWSLVRCGRPPLCGRELVCRTDGVFGALYAPSSQLTEIVEFPVAHSAEKRLPFVW